MLHDPKFWLAISFVIFFSLFLKYVLPILLKIIDNKASQIKSELQKAKELKEKAQQLLIEAQKYHHESVAFSEKLIAEAKEEANQLISDSKNAVEEELNKKMNLAMERIKQEEEKALREIKSRIIASAIKIIEGNINKIGKKSSDISTNNAIVDVSKLIH